MIFNSNESAPFLSLVQYLLSMRAYQKRLILMLFDGLSLMIAFWLSLILRDNNFYFLTPLEFFIIFISSLFGLFFLYIFGLYKSLIKYSYYQSFLSITLAAVFYNFLLGALIFIGIRINFPINFLVGIEINFPIDFLIIHSLLIIFIISFSRYLTHWILDADKSDLTIVVIYGAGSSGTQLQAIMNHNRHIKVVGFIDDDVKIQGRYIQGIKVSAPSLLNELIIREGVDEVFIAIPSLEEDKRQNIIKLISKYPVIPKILPSINDLDGRPISESDLKEICIEDLLKREERQPKEVLMKKNISKKNVLITGAGGSIGSELARQIIRLEPSRLILFEISESSLYTIEKELEGLSNDVEIISVLGDIRDPSQLQESIAQFNVNTIYHTSAYKHVPMVEKNIISAIFTNIFGTLNAINSSIKGNVKNFVFISTDKAVRPTNIMGATKRFSEHILQAYAKHYKDNQTTDIQISIVRFGNVLGSSGSVVPLFREQINNGGPVTVTDPNVTRYFMTISEAAQLVLQAGALNSYGDIFILDMGQPKKIIDLARDMVRLSGKTIKDDQNPNGDIEIVYTGLRPGEKLYEELIIGKKTSKTEHEKIIKADEECLEWDNLNRYLTELELHTKNRDFIEIRKIFSDTSNYTYEKNIL